MNCEHKEEEQVVRVAIVFKDLGRSLIPTKKNILILYFAKKQSEF
mgnify:FL=1